MALLASVRVGWVCDKDKKCLQILIDTRYLLKTTRTVQGTRVEKPSALATVFSVFSTIQGKTMAIGHAFSGQIALRLYNHCNHYLCPRPAHVAYSGPLARLQVLQNSGCWMLMTRVKTILARDHHWQNLGKKNLGSTEIEKLSWQSTDGLSATALPHKMAVWWPRGSTEFQQAARIKPDSLLLALTTKP